MFQYKAWLKYIFNKCKLLKKYTLRLDESDRN